VALISVSLALSQTPAYTARPRIRDKTVSHIVPVYVLAFDATHCAYPRRDGQAELTPLTAWLHTETVCTLTVTHPNTNLAQCKSE